MAWVTGSSWTSLGLYRVKEQWRSAPVDRMALCWTAHRQEKTGSMVPAPRQGRPLPGQRPKPSRLEHNSSWVDLRTRDAGQCPAEAELCEALASSNGQSAVSFVPVGCDKFGAGQGSEPVCRSRPWRSTWVTPARKAIHESRTRRHRTRRPVTILDGWNSTWTFQAGGIIIREATTHGVSLADLTTQRSPNTY